MVDNLLIDTANCCKPIPGEKIIGYITQGRGITIHNDECTNVLYSLKIHPKLFTTASWGKKTNSKYPADIIIKAFNHSELLRNITNILSEEKISITKLIQSKYSLENIIKITIEISGSQPLTQILNKINKFPDIIEIYRGNRS